jgi:hypothetical protein
MAVTNNPPPQAYTREVLAQAYNWLKSQPPIVRERAQSADALVSLFLHSKRFGNSTVTPWDQDSDVGAQAFKSDLKNLAQGFKDFESNVVEHMAVQQPSQPAQTQATATATTQTVQTVTTTQVKATSNTSLGKELDMRTIELLRDVQLRLNLQSELDALRMLVVLGYEKIKSVLPTP